MIAIFGILEKKESVFGDFVAILLLYIEKRSIFAAENKTNITFFH